MSSQHGALDSQGTAPRTARLRGRGRRLARMALLVGITLALTGLGLAQLASVGQAQDGDIEVNKTLEGSQTVRVGEVITFHITIRNSTPFSLTTVPLTDVFRADILSTVPISVTPAYDSLSYVANTGVISWTDIASHFGGFIRPGQTVTVTLSFTAEHPTQELTVVNRAGVHDAINTQGQSGFAGSDESQHETIGGATQITKTLERLGDQAEPGMPVTFTIQIRNNGAADITYLPLEDSYDPALLAYNFAVPTPTLVITSTGLISWADLTTFFGPITGETTITVTTVYTLVGATSVQTSVNQARVSGAQDEYNNQIAPGQDEVPIHILLPATATPVPTPSEEEEEEEATPTPTATSTPIATPTTLPTPTPTLAFPTTLPETGTPLRGWPLVVMGLLLAVGGGAVLMLKTRFCS